MTLKPHLPLPLIVPTMIGLVMIALAGCSQPAPPTDPPPQVVTFEGTMEPRLVGTWKPDKGAVTLTMNKDGSAETSGKVATPGGQVMTRNAGKWLASGDTVMFRYNLADGKTLGDPTKYRWNLEGEKLILTRDGTKYKFGYTRLPTKL